jgi:hypothetical protein
MTHCLNCDQETHGKFCENCGQKTDTHRIVLRHFFMHDLLHGMWHLEKGILFTIREILMRPGQAALDYIKGKRIRYYNVFYLSLLLIGLNILVSHFLDGIHKEAAETPQESRAIIDFLEKNIKIILLCVVPVIALNAMFVFRRLKLNFAEHLIIGGFNLAGMLLMNLLLTFFNFINTYGTPDFVGIFEFLSFLACVFFPFWVYYNASKKLYTFGGFLWRFLLFYFLLWTVITALLVYLTLLLTGKTDLYLNI